LPLLLAVLVLVLKLLKLLKLLKAGAVLSLEPFQKTCLHK